MKRRFLCVLLPALILISLLPLIAQPVRAAETMKTSDACVEILKDMEGFLEHPKADHGQYSIGYGSGCDPDDYPNGITREEAEELLREYLKKFEKNVNSLAQRYNLTFSQQQFDALMLFTYNVGGNWVNSDGAFRQAVISGAKGNDFIYPFCQWSVSSGELNLQLVQRRLTEADLYLNGSYDNKCPGNYTYVLFDNNGGIGDARVQGYDTKLYAPVKPVPILTGHRFLGWYTEKEGGSWVNQLTASHAKKTLYARWQKGAGDMGAGTAANYQRSARELGALSLYDAPGGKAVGTLDANATVQIVADYVDAGNTKWGKLKEGNWVNLGNAVFGVIPSDTGEKHVEVTVTGSGVNVRTGPGMDYGVCGGVTKGDKITILQTQMSSTVLWGRFAEGWLSLRYTDYYQVTSQDPGTPGEPEQEDPKVIDAGVVTAGLRIRSGPGTNYPTVGSLNIGDRVNIYQKKSGTGMTWGKIKQGWISLNYVNLDSEPDEKPEDKPQDDSSEKTVGIVKTGLNIRSGPGTNYGIVGGYPAGTKVEILEQKNVSGTTWGKTNKGWISLKYVDMNSYKPEEDPAVKPNPEGASGVVTAKNGLLIRKGPGTNYGVAGAYNYNTKILVLEQSKIGTTTWGHTDKGWVCLDYVKMSGKAPEVKPEEKPEEKPGDNPQGKPEDKPTAGGNGTVISNTGLNIRSAPGTNNPQVGAYNPGDRITILEQTSVSGVAWGKTDRGWVCMKFVQLDTDANVKYNATVTASSLAIRSTPGIDGKVCGFYKNGAKVQILETGYVKGQAWGKTDLGWICLAYVKK